MEFQKNKIVTSLKDIGWEIVQIEKPETNFYWWVTEIIELKKQKKKLFLSLVIDPQLTKPLAKAEAIGFSFVEPETYQESMSFDMFYIGNNWNGEFKRVIERLQNS